MKKLIALLFAISLIAIVSCNSVETKTEVKKDSTVVKVDTSKVQVEVVKK